MEIFVSIHRVANVYEIERQQTYRKVAQQPITLGPPANKGACTITSLF